MNSPVPSLAFAPAEVNLPPITKVGSNLPCAKIDATRLVVVVLPCVPAIAIPCLRRMSSPNITARCMTGTWAALAAKISGLSPVTAVEITTASALPIWLALCPINISAPNAFNRCVDELSDKSEPLTRYPKFNNTSAMPLIPAPPIPTKWMC